MAGPLDNIKHERFCQEVVGGKSRLEAYRLAGYKPDEGAAFRLSKNVRVKARIAELGKKIVDRYAVNNDRIIREMALLGFANLQDYAALIKDGNLEAVDRDQAAALTEMTIETYMEGKGKDAQPVKRVKVKMADKLAPLTNLAKMLGMFNEDKSSGTQVVFNIIRPETKRISHEK